VTWQLHIPHRNLDEPLNAAAIEELPHALPPGDERLVVRQLLLDARSGGIETVGALLADVERSDPARRRFLLDRARAGVGLAPSHKVEAAERLAAATHEAEVRAAASSVWQTCAEPSCSAVPLTAAGSVAPSTVKRWFCREHEELAAPGDLQPRAALAWGRNGWHDPEADAEEAGRHAAAEESRRHAREQRSVARAAEASEYLDRQRAERARVDRELPDAMMPR
jgi:hypothetical protein